MDLPGNIFRVTSVDINELRNEVVKITEGQWVEWDLRQNRYRVHQSTYTYPFLFSEYGEPAKEYNISTRAWELTKPIVSNLERLYNRRVGVAILVLLRPRMNIVPHVDSGWFVNTHRLHIPIVTDPRIHFILNKKRYHLEPGYAYEMNNRVTHHVENPTGIGRIHLMVDILPRYVVNHAIEKSPLRSIGYKSLEIKELGEVM